jgi:hypothetical protein
VVGYRDSNHPEACGQENRFNFRLRPKRTPKPMDIQDVHSIGLRFTDEVQNLFDHAAGNARTSTAQRRRGVGIIIAASMNLIERSLRHCKMGRSDGFGRIAPVINHQHRQVAAMAGGAERPQMFFSVGRIVMATGSKARSRFALIHPRPAVTFFVNMKPVLPRAATRKAWV